MWGLTVQKEGVVDYMDTLENKDCASEKHYKRAFLGIVGLQTVSRYTPFLRCQADQQSVLLDPDFK